MLDLSIYRESIWPPVYRPRGEGSFEKESFISWWERNQVDLLHLHEQLAEQWIYRHWAYSKFAFLPLQDISWKLVEFDGEHLLDILHREFGGELNPQFDFETFARRGGTDRHPTALALDAGTWDYPLVTLSTPSGILSDTGPLPDARLVLVEGHQRHRYLNALHKLGKAPRGPHKVFILESPMAL